MELTCWMDCEACHPMCKSNSAPKFVPGTVHLRVRDSIPIDQPILASTNRGANMAQRASSRLELNHAVCLSGERIN